MVKIFTLVTNELIISEVVEEVGRESKRYYLLKYPAQLMPAPPQPGQQENKLVFMRAMPFSNHDKPISLNKVNMVTSSYPVDELKTAYENWVVQTKAQEAGIIAPNIVSP